MRIPWSKSYSSEKANSGVRYLSTATPCCRCPEQNPQQRNHAECIMSETADPICGQNGHPVYDNIQVVFHKATYTRKGNAVRQKIVASVRYNNKVYSCVRIRKRTHGHGSSLLLQLQKAHYNDPASQIFQRKLMKALVMQDINDEDDLAASGWEDVRY